MLVNAEGKSPSKVWATYLALPQLWQEDEAWLLCSRWKGDYLHLLQEENKGEQSLGCTWALSWVTFWLVHYFYFFQGCQNQQDVCVITIWGHTILIWVRGSCLSHCQHDLCSLTYVSDWARPQMARSWVNQIWGSLWMVALDTWLPGIINRDGIVQLTSILGCTIRNQPFACHIFI